VVSEVEDSEWQEPLVREFYVATSCQEMAENHHDPAHAKSVHGVEFPGVTERMEGAYQYMEYPSLGHRRECFGLGLEVMRVHGVTTSLSCLTPIDQDNIHIRWLFTAPKSSGPEILRRSANVSASGTSQDLPIIENKVYRSRPVLTKGEVGIPRLREWSRQFYSFPNGEAEDF
jgi:hypothetical protein